MVIEIFKQILGEKKVAVIEFLASNAYEDGTIKYKITEICSELNISKPTVIETLKLLEQKGVIKKIKTGVYKLTLEPQKLQTPPQKMLG